ncbi:MAG: phospholipase D family protein [Gammaproteobacteria bacterium]|nr:phospholipase D family protein [Gammaproteobacteria bacterium]
MNHIIKRFIRHILRQSNAGIRIELPVGIILLLLLTGCASLPDNSHRSKSFAYTETQNTRYGMAQLHEKRAHPGKSGFLLLADGLDAYVARTILARGAERSIDVQYYMIHDDLVGKLFVHELLKAADRGVRIRLLVDDIGLQGRTVKVSTLSAHSNIEVRVFNPFSRNMPRNLQFITRFGSVTRRMHNKSFTVDNQASILGGRNIGNEYFDADPDLAFSDLDVLTIGPAVKEVSESFDLYWNHQLAYPASLLSASPPSQKEAALARKKIDDFAALQQNSDYVKALANSEMVRNYRDGKIRFTWGDAVIVADNPDKFIADRSETHLFLATDLGIFFKNIKQELIIFSPYFVPGKTGAEGLINMSKRGVRIRILTNSLASTDVTAVHAGYARYRKRLLRAGIELYEMNNTLTKKQRKEKKGPGGSSKASLHAKSFIFDRNKVFIGSFNLDPRSHTENSEIGMVMASPVIANDMSEWFDQNIDKVAFRLELRQDSIGVEQIIWHGLKDGEKRTYTREPHVGPLRKAGVALLQLLPIESQL